MNNLAYTSPSSKLQQGRPLAPTDPPVQREIPRELGQLHFSIEQLEAAYGRLMERLSPVTAPWPVGAEKKDDTGVGCEIGGQIRTATKRIAALQQSITQLSEQVQV